jgi:hypothetical protein
VHQAPLARHERAFFMLIHKAELYDLAGNKLPQRYVCYLPQGALLGMTRREVEAKISLENQPVTS